MEIAMSQEPPEILPPGVYRVPIFDRTNGLAIRPVKFGEADEMLLRKALPPSSISDEETDKLEQILRNLRSAPSSGFSQPKAWLLVVTPQKSGETTGSPPSTAHAAEKDDTSVFDYYTTRRSIDDSRLWLHEITHLCGSRIQVAVQRPWPGQRNGFHRDAYHGTGDWIHDPDTGERQHRLGRYLLAAAEDAGLHVFSDPKAYDNWRKKLRDKLARYELPSGETFADVCLDLESFDRSTASERLRGITWPRPWRPNLFVVGIVDTVQGRVARIRRGREDSFQFAEEIARPGVAGTNGPFLLFGTVTLDPTDPSFAVLTKAYAHPIWQIERPCPVDSINERLAVDAFDELGRRQFALGVRAERILFPLELPDGQWVLPDFLISRDLSGSCIRLLVEVLGFNPPGPDDASDQNAFARDYRIRKERQKTAIIPHALYAEIDAKTARNPGAVIRNRADEIIHAFSRVYSALFQGSQIKPAGDLLDLVSKLRADT
ncbi:MAG: hypothetical protein IAE82_00860 [Opitutaceae bacterium]|nr:hypothetical protein [Opitutaceae bacterium]